MEDVGGSEEDAVFKKLNMNDKYDKFKFCDQTAGQEVMLCKKDRKDIDDDCKKRSHRVFRL